MRTLDHIKHFCDMGTQGEVALTGIGEGILYPRFEEAVHHTRAVIGDKRPITLATNGVALEDHHIRVMRDYKVYVFVSLHRPEKASVAVDKLLSAGVSVNVNHAFVDSSLDWAGQVKWHVSAPPSECQYLKRGWVVVRQDGSVNTCCMDAHSKYKIGSVFDQIGSLQTRATELCDSCNLTVPPELQPVELPKKAKGRKK